MLLFRATKWQGLNKILETQNTFRQISSAFSWNTYASWCCLQNSLSHSTIIAGRTHHVIIFFFFLCLFLVFICLFVLLFGGFYAIRLGAWWVKTTQSFWVILEGCSFKRKKIYVDINIFAFSQASWFWHASRFY